MYEVDLASPSLGLDDDEDGLVAWIDGLSDQELQDLELEARLDGYDAGDAAPEDELGEWADGLGDAEFSNVMEEAAVYGDASLDFLDFSRRLDAGLATMTNREHDRQAQDRADRERRSGAHHNRPTAEEVLARGLARYQGGTYLRDQLPAELANDPDMESLFSTRPSLSSQEVHGEMMYQLYGSGPRPAAQRYREPLPPVASLAKRIGVRS